MVTASITGVMVKVSGTTLTVAGTLLAESKGGVLDNVAPNDEKQKMIGHAPPNGAVGIGVATYTGYPFSDTVEARFKK